MFDVFSLKIFATLQFCSQIILTGITLARGEWGSVCNPSPYLKSKCSSALVHPALSAHCPQAGQPSEIQVSFQYCCYAASSVTVAFNRRKDGRGLERSNDLSDCFWFLFGSAVFSNLQSHFYNMPEMPLKKKEKKRSIDTFIFSRASTCECASRHNSPFTLSDHTKPRLLPQ